MWEQVTDIYNMGNGEVVDLTPPHDVLGQKIGQYLPKD